MGIYDLKFADLKWSINTFELIYNECQQIPYTAISSFHPPPTLKIEVVVTSMFNIAFV